MIVLECVWGSPRRVAFDEDDHAGVGAWVVAAARVARLESVEVEAELVEDRREGAAG